MAERPFKCHKCGNWYIAVPHEGECYLCAEGTHGRHPKTDEFDCHFGHESATYSEVQMARLLEDCRKHVALIEALPQVCQQAESNEALSSLLKQGEAAFGKLEKANRDIPRILDWAGVFELPGRKDDEGAGRFKNLDALRELVKTNRRPKADLAMMERSAAVCTDMADDIPGLLATARLALARARKAAEAWVAAPVTAATAQAQRNAASAERMKKTWAERKAKAANRQAAVPA